MQYAMLSVDTENKFGDLSLSPRGGNFGIIRCMFLCWFDTTAGPKIALQVPEGVLSKEQFDSISAYVIPKVQLCNCVLAATIDGLTVIGSPQVVTNERYLRNEYIFNVCVCVNEDCDADTLADCEMLVRKLGNYLNGLERDYSYLSLFTNPSSSTSNATPSTASVGTSNANQIQVEESASRFAKQNAGLPRYRTATSEATVVKWYLTFPELFEQIYTELNASGYSKARVNDSTSILLRLRASQRAFTGASRNAIVPTSTGQLTRGLTEVHEYDVPIVVQPIVTERSRERDRERDSQSDPTVRQLLSFVNGERHVLQIALETDMNLSITKACFQNLIHFGVVRFISVFQFSNVYICTERVNQLLMNELAFLPFGPKASRNAVPSLPGWPCDIAEFDEDDSEEDCACIRRALLEELQSCFKESRDAKSKAAAAVPLTSDDLMHVVLFFKHFVGVSVRHVCDRMDNSQLQRVDVRKLVQFGELHGILRRVHCYPVYNALQNDALCSGTTTTERKVRTQLPFESANGLRNGDSKWQQVSDTNSNWKATEKSHGSLIHPVAHKATQLTRSPTANQVTFANGFEKPEWYALCDGKHHTDEIYCLFALPYNTVNDAIDQDPDLFVIWK